LGGKEEGSVDDSAIDMDATVEEIRRTTADAVKGRYTIAVVVWLALVGSGKVCRL
jgi:hypothetical protein